MPAASPRSSARPSLAHQDAAPHPPRRIVSFAPDTPPIGRSLSSLTLDRIAAHNARILASAPPVITPTFRKSFAYHSDWVNDILLVADNTRLVSASSDRILFLWDTATRADGGDSTGSATPVKIGHHSDYVKRVTSVGRDAVASAVSIARSWSVIASLESPSGSVYSLASNKTGSMLASGSPEKIVRLWDPLCPPNSPIMRLQGHADNIRDLLVSDDGRWVLSASSDSTVKLWSVAMARCWTTYAHFEAPVWCLASGCPRLETFWAGCRDGLVTKTSRVRPFGSVLPASASAAASEPVPTILGVDTADEIAESVAVCRESGPVFRIAGIDDLYVWTATPSSHVNRWRDVPVAATTSVSTAGAAGGIIIPKSSLTRQTPTSQLDDAASTHSHLASSLSVDASAQSMQPAAGDAGPNAMSSGDDESGEGNPLIPVWTSPVDRIPGAPAIIKHTLLNNRRHVVTADTSGTITLREYAPSPTTQTASPAAGQSGLGGSLSSVLNTTFEAVVEAENTTEWVSNCGVITCYDGEVYHEDLGLDVAPASDDQRVNLARWVLTYLLVGYLSAVFPRDASIADVVNGVVPEPSPSSAGGQGGGGGGNGVPGGRGIGALDLGGSMAVSVFKTSLGSFTATSLFSSAMSQSQFAPIGETDETQPPPPSLAAPLSTPAPDSPTRSGSSSAESLSTDGDVLPPASPAIPTSTLGFPDMSSTRDAQGMLTVPSMLALTPSPAGSPNSSPTSSPFRPVSVSPPSDSSTGAVPAMTQPSIPRPLSAHLEHGDVGSAGIGSPVLPPVVSPPTPSVLAVPSPAITTPVPVRVATTVTSTSTTTTSTTAATIVGGPGGAAERSNSFMDRFKMRRRTMTGSSSRSGWSDENNAGSNDAAAAGGISGGGAPGVGAQDAAGSAPGTDGAKRRKWSVSAAGLLSALTGSKEGSAVAPAAGPAHAPPALPPVPSSTSNSGPGTALPAATAATTTTAVTATATAQPQTTSVTAQTAHQQPGPQPQQEEARKINYDETPLIRLPPTVPLIISYEESAEASTYMDVFRSTSGSLGVPATVRNLEEIVPPWLFDWIVQGTPPPKDPAKLAFVVQPHPDSRLPTMPANNARLNANRMLRIKKVIAYVGDRLGLNVDATCLVAPSPASSPTLPTPVPAVPGSPLLAPSSAGQRIRIWCNDKVLSPRTTLATTKHHIWKSGADIQLFYQEY
ncbi:hypothetical protein BC831DRAFT_458429 [Entophlyctis helioformis]|nr:hypothetical protein BC831DRAFT_458429 [Entophlyctis helioformis]